jgi:YfiH family protein
VLFADPEARVIGAAHAGWRGALAGVLEATVGAMVKLGAATDRIVVTIGPAIAQRSYEVGPEFPAPFLAADATNATFFSSSVNHGRWMFDLKAYVASRLGNAGLRHVGIMPNDTCGEPERFFSYRRSCLRGEPDYGRMLSAIVLD